MIITGHESYFVVLCDDSKFIAEDARAANPPLICGVYGSRVEAQKVAKRIKNCVCTHTIKQCTVTVEV